LLPELSISLKSHGYIVSRKASVRGVHHQQLARRRPGTACSLGKKQQHVFAFIKQGALADALATGLIKSSSSERLSASALALLDAVLGDMAILAIQ
jgi:hypothetical protein